MTALNSLKNTHKTNKRIMRVGRGPGSGKGKTCGRGIKGMGARSGYRKRYTYEGGQFRLFMKLPTRGFNRARFRKALDAINLKQLEKMFNDGDTVNVEALVAKGYINANTHGIKILGEGELSKKLTIEAHAFSASATKKLQEAGVSFNVIGEK